MMNKDLTMLEILGTAIRAEIESFKLYTKIAAKVSNPIVKDKFTALAREEKSHRTMLEEIYKKRGGNQKLLVPKKSLKQTPGEIDVDKSSYHDILKIAIKKEKDARAFYLEALIKATDRSGKFILQYLADFERNHQRALEQELKALDDYPMWWDSEGPGIQFIGP